MNEERLQYSIALAAEAAGVGLARMPVAMLGVRYKGKQRIQITRAMLDQVVANFRKMETPVPVDYDHAIKFAAGAGEPVPASGWIKGIDDAPDDKGILWGAVEWSPRAAEMIAAKEYQYISPVLDPNERDSKTGQPQGWTLTSAALTNQPVLQGMPALVLSQGGWVANADEAERAKAVKVTRVIIADRAARTARAVLDDGEEVTLQIEGLEEPRTVLTLSNVQRKDGNLDFSALPCEGDVLVAGEVFRAMRSQELILSAIKDGKILPAQRPQFEKLAAADPAGFEALVLSMKPQVDMRTRGTGGEGRGVEQTELQSVDAEIHELVLSKTKESKDLEYGDALIAVLHARPDLDRRRKAAMKQ